MIRCILMVGLALSFSTNADAARLKVRCEVLDAETGRPVPSAEVEVTVNPPPQPAIRDGSEFVYQKDDFDITALRAVGVQVSAEEGYLPRQIVLRHLGQSPDFDRRIQLWLVPEAADLSYQALGRFRRLLEGGETERALAIYEAASSHLRNRHGQYGVHVRYNLARSLAQACRVYGYESCERASTICSELLEERESRPIYRKIFQNERLTVEALKKCEADASTGVVMMLASDIRRAYREGGVRLLAAAKGWESIVEAPPDEASVWAKLGWPRSAAARDAGTAYVRYADFLARKENAPPEEVARQLAQGTTLLRRAIDWGVRDTGTIGSYEYAASKLENLEQAGFFEPAPE